VNTQSDPTGPSLPTIKQLFAHSGNRCAFPQCTEALLRGSTVVGKICHIKAAKPKGPRYDPQQSATERHSYDNLILLCGTHHTVIDDDEKTYPAARIIKMKADHEARATRISDDFAETAAHLLINESVTTVNQSGGIAAHTIHADTINVHPPSVPRTRPTAWQLQPTAGHPSSFIEDGKTLCRPRSIFGSEPVLDIVWDNGPQFFMRIVPSVPLAKPWNFTELKAMIDAARLLPLPGYHESYFSSVNQFGAVVLNCRHAEDQNSAEQITQVSRHGEIWGIDKRRAVDGGKIQFGEKTIAHALQGYLSFARDYLRMEAPLTIIAGLTEVQGYEFHHPIKGHVWWNPSVAYCNCPTILWEDQINDLNTDPAQMLLPFFDTVWDSCGLVRKEWFPEDYP
jgi:hypothetical protein